MDDYKKNIPLTVFTSTLSWSISYYFILELTGRSPEWSCRLITAVHAVVITFLASLDWAVMSPWTMDRLGEENTPYQQHVIAIALGYFIFDMIWVLIHRTEGYVMYCHHIASLICLFFILFSGASGAEALLGIAGLELTNPCLQARWYLRTHGFQGTTIHTLTEVMFMVTFILFRLIYGTYLVYNITFHSKSHVFVKYGSIMLYCISWVFLGQMLCYIYKKYIKTNENIKKKEK